MATPKSQRIGIWIIAVVLMMGTLGSFLVMGLNMNNQKVEAANQQETSDKAWADYQAQQKVVAKVNAENAEVLTGYSTRVFDPDVTDLRVETLVAGTGEVVKATDSIKASYSGWMSDGVIFDSSKKKDAEDSPIVFALDSVIEGWTEGLTGVKVGSVVRLTIPSDKAYKSAGSGVIPADAPLEFIVKINSIEEAQDE